MRSSVIFPFCWASLLQSETTPQGGWPMFVLPCCANQHICKCIWGTCRQISHIITCLGTLLRLHTTRYRKHWFLPTKCQRQSKATQLTGSDVQITLISQKIMISRAVSALMCYIWHCLEKSTCYPDWQKATFAQYIEISKPCFRAR